MAVGNWLKAEEVDNEGNVGEEDLEEMEERHPWGWVVELVSGGQVSLVFFLEMFDEIDQNVTVVFDVGRPLDCCDENLFVYQRRIFLA